jgi:hypothetical protein
MPKNTVSDPITDQEMAFAHLVLSGTMNDRRAAVRERLVDQEAGGLRQLSLGRDQILARLWELANLSPEATRGSIAGQVKALSMIVAIEGLIPKPDLARRLSPSGSQPAAPPVKAQIYESEWLRKQQHQAAPEESGDPFVAAEPQPAAPQAPDPEPPPPLHQNFDPNQPSLANPFINPQPLNRVPGATGSVLDAVLDRASSSRPSFSPNRRFSGRRR